MRAKEESAVRRARDWLKVYEAEKSYPDIEVTFGPVARIVSDLLTTEQGLRRYVDDKRAEWRGCESVYPLGYGCAMNICDELDEFLNDNSNLQKPACD